MFTSLKEETFPADFLDDVLVFCGMFYNTSLASGVHGEEHQKEMLGKWPQAWMDVVFEEIGKFGEGS